LFIFLNKDRSFAAQLTRKNLCTRKLAERDAKQSTARLTNPHNMAEHKYDTLLWVMVAEYGRNDASSSDFP
jgi:hypothetical protein